MHIMNLSTDVQTKVILIFRSISQYLTFSVDVARNIKSKWNHELLQPENVFSQNSKVKSTFQLYVELKFENKEHKENYV